MEHKTMGSQDQIYNGLAKAMGFIIGWLYYQFLKIPEVHAWGEILSFLRSCVYGGGGAVGAWLVKTYILKRVDELGGWKPWLRSIYKRKSK